MRSLPEALTGILLAALAACDAEPPPARTGGVPYTGPAPDPTSGTAAVACSDTGNMRKLYEKLRWAPDVESVALYALPVTYPGGPPLPPGSRAVLRHMGGAPCKTDACEAERDATAQTFVAEASDGRGWVYFDEMFQDTYYPSAKGFAVVRRGGKQVLVTTLEALRGYLARITSADVAQAWAALHRIGATCGGDGPNVVVGDGFHELRQEYSTCRSAPHSPPQTLRMTVVHRVFADGRIESGTPREVGRAPAHDPCMTPGRAPLGGFEGDAADASFGSLLARLAGAEAASVVAFRELANALATEGAPPCLVARAREAGRDEERHAARMETHARAHGGRVEPPSAPEGRYESLRALALHNAREGCVNEAYAALVTMHQARFAADPSLRDDLRGIAQDELRHAAWSHDLDAWLTSRLSPSDQQAIAAEKARALAELERAACSPPSAAARRAGMPEPRVAAHLVAGLRTLVGEALASPTEAKLSPPRSPLEGGPELG